MYFKTILSCFAVLLIANATNNASAVEEEVHIYKWLGKAPKGSNMRPIEAKSPIPFKKRYHQLTDTQMLIYRSYFEGLKDNETPPFPKKGLREIYGPLIKGHAQIGGGGTLLLYSEISEKGEVNKVTVYESPTKKLAELATAVMFNTKFIPATCNGDPCVMEYPFHYEVPFRQRSLKSLNREDFRQGDGSSTR